jgi:3-hydroxy-9,10-secoandrosta-1,3,5(10)-triene-9,17-dione monooxygenase
LRERAPYTEQLRRLPDETLKEFQEAGLFRALQPKRYGGYELDPGTFYQAVMDIGTVCGSSAWVLGVIGVHNWQLALFPAQAQEDIWGEETSIQISTSLAPTGTVEHLDGGFRLHGRWSFSSGCDFCQWALLGGIAPSTQEGTPPDRRAFLIPRHDYTIDDTWQVIGLCGTGSKDIVVTDAFVPEYRTFSYREAFEIRSPGLTLHDAPVYRLPFGIIFPYGIASPAIGVALGALHFFREQARTRVWSRDQSRVAEDPFVQFRLAEAAAAVDAARDRLLRCFADMMQRARSGQEIPLAHRARYRWEAAHAVALSVQAADRLFEASGGRAIFLNNPIQRAWRDVHAMRAHAGNNPEKMAAIFGRSEFGLPPQDFAF